MWIIDPTGNKTATWEADTFAGPHSYTWHKSATHGGQTSWDFTVWAGWDANDDGVVAGYELLYGVDVHVLDLDAWMLWDHADSANCAVEPPYLTYHVGGISTVQAADGSKRIDYCLVTGQTNSGETHADLSKLGQELGLEILNRRPGQPENGQQASNWTIYPPSVTSGYLLIGHMTWTDPRADDPDADPPLRNFDVYIWHDVNHNGVRDVGEPQKKLSVGIMDHSCIEADVLDLLPDGQPSGPAGSFISGINQSTIRLFIEGQPATPLSLTPIVGGYHFRYNLGPGEASPGDEIRLEAQDNVGNQRVVTWYY